MRAEIFSSSLLSSQRETGCGNLLISAGPAPLDLICNITVRVCILFIYHTRMYDVYGFNEMCENDTALKQEPLLARDVAYYSTSNIYLTD
jgi:hypothetical protein